MSQCTQSLTGDKCNGMRGWYLGIRGGGGALSDKGLGHDEADRAPQACYGRKDNLPSGQVPAP